MGRGRKDGGLMEESKVKERGRRRVEEEEKERCGMKKGKGRKREGDR